MPLNTFKYLILLALLSLSGPLWADYPQTVWTSERFSDSLLQVKFGHPTECTAEIVPEAPPPQPVLDAAHPKKTNKEPVAPVMVESYSPPEWVTLGQKTLTIYHWNTATKKTEKFFELKSQKNQTWVKLGLMDLNNDGCDEVVISGFENQTTVGSWIYSWNGKQFSLWDELPYFLSVVQNEGTKNLVAQKSFGSDDFSGPLLVLKPKEGSTSKDKKISSSKLGLDQEWNLPGGLSGEKFSLYSIAPLSPSPLTDFISLSNSGALGLYTIKSRPSPTQTDQAIPVQQLGEKTIAKESADKISKLDPWRRTWQSGVSYGGVVFSLKREIKNVMNETEQKRFSIPLTPLVFKSSLQNSYSVKSYLPVINPPMVASTEKTRLSLRSDGDGDSKIKAYVIKNEGYLKNVIGSETSIKSSQIVGLTETGFGLQEVYNSPRFDGAIADAQLVDWDGNGDEEVVLVLWLKESGFTDTLKRQDSVILVVDPSKQ